MPRTKKDEPGRTRDRDATAGAILQAAKATLAEEGFAAFGVNAVARRAGCDKQLIYRYFGGLDGLLEAVGEDLGETLSKDLAAHMPPSRPASYGDLIATAAAELIDVYRRNPLLRQIHAWETAAPSPLLTRLAAARSRQLLAWSQDLRGDLAAPEGADVGALNASLFAAAQQLAIAGCATGGFAGMPLKAAKDWARARAAIRRLAEAAYGD